MTVAVDIGGTKTLVASVENNQVSNQIKFPTPQDYKQFITQLIEQIRFVTANHPLSLVSMAIPGMLDRTQGIVKLLGNLPWTNKPIVSDLSHALNEIKVIIENDANLAALSEANSLKNINQRVLYITFSTGVGTGFVINGVLDPDLLDCEGGHMVFEHEGKMMDWESFSAGRAIVDKYGKMAAELDDPTAWREIAKNMAIGIVDNNSIFQADTIIIGGGVGTYFNKYGVMLREEVDNLLKETSMIKKPTVVGARHAEEAVLLGCIIYAEQYEQRK
jgi:predicted NBD/HSP70 family sugar kinase